MGYTFGKENTLFVVDALVGRLCRLGVGGKLLKFTRAPKYLNVLNVPSSYVCSLSQNLRFLAATSPKNVASFFLESPTNQNTYHCLSTRDQCRDISICLDSD